MVHRESEITNTSHARLDFIVQGQQAGRQVRRLRVEEVSPRLSFTMSSLLVLVLLCLWTESGSLKLPRYIKGCSRNDPNLNDCALKSALVAIPQFIDGDPKYRVPPLDPILVNELAVNQGSRRFGLHFLARNATLEGLRSVILKDVRIDLDKQHIEYEMVFPNLTIKCKYNVTGQVLVLPITGNGDGIIILKDIEATYKYDYDRAKIKGKEYVAPKNAKLLFDVKGMTIHLDNLFNGDKFLGDNMNIFLNENWRDLVKEVGPSIAEAMTEVMTTLLTNIFELVPYDVAFPE